MLFGAVIVLLCDSLRTISNTAGSSSSQMMGLGVFRLGGRWHPLTLIENAKSCRIPYSVLASRGPAMAAPPSRGASFIVVALSQLPLRSPGRTRGAAGAHQSHLHIKMAAFLKMCLLRSLSNSCSERKKARSASAPSARSSTKIMEMVPLGDLNEAR